MPCVFFATSRVLCFVLVHVFCIEFFTLWQANFFILHALLIVNALLIVQLTYFDCLGYLPLLHVPVVLGARSIKHLFTVPVFFVLF